MTDRIIYVSRNCPHCKKLLIGLHRYSFLKSQFRMRKTYLLRNTLEI